MPAHFGMIGLGTMGSNLVMNIADHGFEVCGYDRDEKQRKKLQEVAGDRPVTTAATPEEFVAALQTPRIIMLLVPAGKIVDTVIGEITPLLSKGDILIDGGNSHYTDTERRYAALRDSGFHFIGMGVSGGEEGARFGPSLMPGGNKESYELMRSILEAIAAKSDEGACVAYIGNAAAGHYTKMVHNGIEYAMMQLISEVYGILKYGAGISNERLQQIFAEWNKAELQSFLVEITADIFLKKDDDTGNDLVDMILDKAKQKGTGLWTSQSALELNVPLPTIDSAVTMRYLSALKTARQEAAAIYPAHAAEEHPDAEQLIAAARNALYMGFLLAYGQGLQLLTVASAQFSYDINIAEVIRVWKGGCIIRSAMLNDLRKAYTQDPALSNLILSPVFSESLKKHRGDMVSLLQTAMASGLPAATFAATLSYFDAYCRERLPANLIQAQRDYFGAHTYERIDKEGVFHADWENKAPTVTPPNKDLQE